MKLFPTFFAHWKLHAMIRSWQKAEKILDKVSSFIAQYATEEENMLINSKVNALREAFDEITTKYENKIIADLKERV